MLIGLPLKLLFVSLSNLGVFLNLQKSGVWVRGNILDVESLELIYHLI